MKKIYNRIICYLHHSEARRRVCHTRLLERSMDRTTRVQLNQTSPQHTSAAHPLIRKK